jgi:hypothetical protein|tara:strand:+ start:288 stop:431 length:144 start_codon:yes stop_codon:yes gene_type:complete
MEEYPIVLTYSYPGNIVTVRCDNKEQADRAFDEMFDRCGQDVKYSVD